MNFLNSGRGLSLFQKERNKITYVDKSLLIEAVYDYAHNVSPYISVTRPRRFGKSTAANMIAAFFEAGNLDKSRELFDELSIGKERQKRQMACWEDQGQLNLIRINMIDLITERTKSYQDFIDTLNRRLMEDIAKQYPSLHISAEASIPEALELTEDTFAFVIDEWDAIFEMRFMRDVDSQDYILFLKSLLKDKSYIQFVYMTGILPIAKYSSGSPLNMFDEFTSFADSTFYPFFGLTAHEIQQLKDEKQFERPSMEELSLWYDGYIRESDYEHFYNPNSVSKALATGICRSYWTGTGPMNEVRDMIQHNVKDLRTDIIRMAGGETLSVELSGFSSEKSRSIQKMRFYPPWWSMVS